MIYTLKNDKITATVSSLGAELTSVKSSNGYEFMWQGTQWNKHAPVLFPLCGSLLDGKYTSRRKEYKMGKHGFARDMEFEVSNISDTSVTMTLSANEKTMEMYPFDFVLSAVFSIKENTVNVLFTVENKGNHVLPYMFGWHPAFAIPGEKDTSTFYVTFPEKKSLAWHTLQHSSFVNPLYTSYPLKPGGKYYINEDEIAENDTLIFKDIPTTVKLAGGGQKHTVTMTYSDNIPYLCLWKWPDPAARYLCIEPWSDVPSDGETPENFDSRQMSRLSAKESCQYTYSVTFE